MDDYCIILPDIISIHALREEGDGESCHRGCRRDISIHALREEGDNRRAGSVRGMAVFLSTPSARRATLVIKVFAPRTDISIHALREEGDVTPKYSVSFIIISIHALREEGDHGRSSTVP